MKSVKWYQWPLVFLLLGRLAAGQPSPSPAAGGEAAPRLPVTRVALYKNGVGYFEHRGPVRGSESVSLRFTSGQLNDALKSLTVLDLGGGRVTGLTYDSSAPLQRRFGELRLPAGEKLTLAEFLAGLRGALIEVRGSGAAVSGRLLSVERKTRINGGTTLEVDYLSLITEAGEVKTAELTPAFAFRLLDKDLASRVARYMDLLNASRDSDVRQMSIAASGEGERPLFVSYISETPVWKTTYRLVLSSKPGASPLLQGWAIVDNTGAEDWVSVRLSLMAGAPQSFVQRISQPYYTRRPVIPMPDSSSIAPQTHESALFRTGARLLGLVRDVAGGTVGGAKVRVFDSSNDLVGEAQTNMAGAYEVASLPDGEFRVEVSSLGFRTSVSGGVSVSAARPATLNAELRIGEVAETIDVSATPQSIQTQASMVARSRTGAVSSYPIAGRPRVAPAAVPAVKDLDPEEARSRQEAAAMAQQAGDLFEYQIKAPVTIRKNQSALVPIVQAPVTAEKVSIWNDSATPPRPRRAVWLTNNTGLTLDGGNFSVLDEETFAGEGLLEALRPGERRLVSYALDPALTALSRQTGEPMQVRRVRISGGVMVQHSEVRETRTYILRNEDAAPRSVIVEHPIRPGYELRSEAQPVETTASRMRFVVPVAAKQTATFIVDEARPIEATFTVSELDADQLAAFVKARSLTRPMEEALQRVLAQQKVVKELEGRLEGLEKERESIYKDQQRLRENLKSLKGSAEEKALVVRYTRLLNDQEDRFEAIEKQLDELEARLEKEEAKLEEIIQAIAFDEKL